RDLDPGDIADPFDRGRESHVCSPFSVAQTVPCPVNEVRVAACDLSTGRPVLARPGASGCPGLQTRGQELLPRPAAHVVPGGATEPRPGQRGCLGPAPGPPSGADGWPADPRGAGRSSWSPAGPARWALGRRARPTLARPAWPPLRRGRSAERQSWP